VEDFFRKLGTSITEAITLFYKQVKLNRGLPFEVRVPNETTLRTFQDTDTGQEIVRCEDAQDVFDKLEL
jgi:DNA-damage-inducible protein J